MRAFACLGLVLVIGCSPASVELAVDLQTDLAPGVEFNQVRVTLDDPIDHPLPDDAAQVVPVSILTRFVDTPRIAEYRHLTGVHEVHVALLHDEEIAAETRSRVRLDRSALVRVDIPRSCIHIMCPDASPTATACFGGRCVDPSCDPELVSMPTDGGPHDAARHDASVIDSGPRDSGVDASRLDAGRPDAGPRPDGGVNDECSFDECTTPSDCTNTQTPPFCVTPICQRGACLYLPTVPCADVDQFCNPATDTCDPLVPNGDGPSNVVATPTSTTVAVTWDAATNAVGYIVEIAPEALFAAPTRHVIDASMRTTTFDMLAQGHHYFVRVRTVRTASVSAWANAQATTSINAPHAPDLALATTGASMPRTSGTWIYVPASPPGNYLYVDVTARTTCPAGTTTQYFYTAHYGGETFDRGPVGPYPANVITVVPRLTTTQLHVTVTARCVTSDATSPPSSATTRCINGARAAC